VGSRSGARHLLICRDSTPRSAMPPIGCVDCTTISTLPTTAALIRSVPWVALRTAVPLMETIVIPGCSPAICDRPLGATCWTQILPVFDAKLTPTVVDAVGFSRRRRIEPPGCCGAIPLPIGTAATVGCMAVAVLETLMSSSQRCGCRVEPLLDLCSVKKATTCQVVRPLSQGGRDK